ncbi:MAG: hypothetical protein HZA54_04885, partial [Planctomycetes bacterium]|nr:hypothetical protein [Planctomycetota bacterium]
YAAALTLIAAGLEAFGAIRGDLYSELATREVECTRNLPAQQGFADFDRLLAAGDAEGARVRLGQIPDDLKTQDWVAKRLTACLSTLQVTALVAQARERYRAGDAETALSLLAASPDAARPEVAELVGRIRSVVARWRALRAAQEKSDFSGAREQALVLVALETDAANKYAADATPIARYDAPEQAAGRLATARGLLVEGRRLEEQAAASFDAGRPAEGEAAGVAAAAKFVEARSLLEQARAFLAQPVEEAAAALRRDAKSAYNLHLNSVQLPRVRRLAFLGIAGAKLFTGRPHEAALADQIAGLIDRLRAEAKAGEASGR